MNEYCRLIHIKFLQLDLPLIDEVDNSLQLARLARSCLDG